MIKKLLRPHEKIFYVILKWVEHCGPFLGYFLNTFYSVSVHGQGQHQTKNIFIFNDENDIFHETDGL